MAILSVTANHDYRPDTVSNIDQINFLDLYTATFNQSQFGGAGISNSLLITGGGGSPYEGLPLVEVFLTPGGTGFSAAQWEIPSIGYVLVRMIGSASSETITGVDDRPAGNEFIGGAGADVLIGGSGDDTFMYAAIGDVESGEKIDGGGIYDDSYNEISVRATNDFRGAEIANIDRITILGAGTIATFFNAQLIPTDYFEPLDKGTWMTVYEGGGTVQTLVVQADSSSGLFAPGEPDASARLKYVSFSGWGKEDRIFINGTEGDDFLFGSDKADVFDAAAGRDELFGRHGKDTLDAGSGRDFLDGGADKDILTGGADKDAFIFSAPLKGGKNLDRITDFEPGADLIRLEREDFVGLDKGKLAKDAFVSGDNVSKAKDAQDRIAYNETTGALFFDRDGKGGAKAFKFAVLEGAPDLEAGDVLVFA